MRKEIIILILILVLNSFDCLCQNNSFKADFVKFEFEHSKRIPYKYVMININNRIDSCVVKVNTHAANKDPKWKYSVLNKSFKIDKKYLMI